jgi:hypothetical protein
VICAIYSLPDSQLAEIFTQIEHPYDLIVNNFLRPYLSHFHSQKPDTWLNQPLSRIRMIELSINALSNIFSNAELATNAIFSDY